MKVVYKEPGEEAMIMHIDNTLKSLQTLVGGCIEHLELAPGIGIVVNEEGKLYDMAPNFFVPGIKDRIIGPAVFVGEDGGLSDEDVRTVMAFLRWHGVKQED